MSAVRTMHAQAERIDWHAIKDRIDLEAVAVALMGPPQCRRGDRGLWWVCPLHADRNPSLCVAPERRRWRCWGCGQHGDAVELVMRLTNTAFPEAVRHVAELCGLAAPSLGTVRPTIRLPTVRPPERPPDEPTGLSHSYAVALVEAAAERLWTPEGAEALEYLRGPRGLTDATIRASRLGYVRDAAIPTRDGDRTYRVSGVAIPWFDDGRLVSAKVRQPEGRKPKYAEAYRDRPRVYPGPAAIRPGFPLVAVEGEFDALLLAQELAGHAAVVTLGSASTHTADDVRRLARACPSLFTAHDADEAGDRAAARWPARAVRVRPPDGCNDWGDVHKRGFNRMRYHWGRFLPLGSPPRGEDFAAPVEGLSDDEPDPYEAAERAAIQFQSREHTNN